jgi:NOL1/NOP2/fmu family ribosome biogenesis protein
MEYKLPPATLQMERSQRLNQVGEEAKEKVRQEEAAQIRKAAARKKQEGTRQLRTSQVTKYVVGSQVQHSDASVNGWYVVLVRADAAFRVLGSSTCPQRRRRRTVRKRKRKSNLK